MSATIDPVDGAMALVDVKAGKLPQPERDGPRFSRWRAGTLIEALSRGVAK